MIYKYSIKECHFKVLQAVNKLQKRTIDTFQFR